MREPHHITSRHTHARPAPRIRSTHLIDNHSTLLLHPLPFLHSLSLSGAELIAVEGERRRLEKERREIFESEAYFYDFDGLRVTYEFDRRHRSEIKEQGIFRQGLQWNHEDLEKLEVDNTRHERERLLKEVPPPLLLLLSLYLSLLFSSLTPPLCISLPSSSPCLCLPSSTFIPLLYTPPPFLQPPPPVETNTPFFLTPPFT